MTKADRGQSKGSFWYCLFLLLCLLLIVLYTTFFRLPESLRTLRAIQIACNVEDAKYMTDPLYVRRPATWRVSDGYHLDVNEDVLCLSCLNAQGKWKSVDVLKIIEDDKRAKLPS